MSRSVNKVLLLGNLGSDPELRSTQNGTRVATISLATNERWKDSNGNQQERTEWHRLVLWRGLAEVANKYLRKGDPIYVEGKIQTRTWEKNGETRYTTEINVQELVMLGSKEGGEQQRSARPEPQPALAGEDDLPF